MKVDREKGKIEGVALMTEGEALTHGEFADSTTLDTLIKSAGSKRHKVKIDHGTGVKANVGYVDNIKREGNKVLGDVTFYKAAKTDADLLLDMAESVGDQFGFSADTQRGIETVSGKKYIRIHSISSFDFVDRPALNPEGLYEQQQKQQEPLPEMTEEEIKKIVGETVAEVADAKFKAFEERIEKLETPTPTPAPTEDEAKEKAEFAQKIADAAVEKAYSKIKDTLGKQYSVTNPTDNKPQQSGDKTFPDYVAQAMADGKLKTDAIAYSIRTQPESHKAWKDAGGGNI